MQYILATDIGVGGGEGNLKSWFEFCITWSSLPGLGNVINTSPVDRKQNLFFDGLKSLK